MTGLTILLPVFGAGAGAAIGSYWGVVADRGWADSVSGRSRCDGCERQLTWIDLVPIVSYIALRGRCRSCGARIPAVLLLREGIGALAGIAIAVALIVAFGV